MIQFVLVFCLTAKSVGIGYPYYTSRSDGIQVKFKVITFEKHFLIVTGNDEDDNNYYYK